MKKPLVAAAATLAALCLFAGCNAASRLGPTTETGADAADPSLAKRRALRPEPGDAKPEYPGEAAAFWAGLHETPEGETAARLNQRAKLELDARRAARGVVDPRPNVRIDDWGPGNFGGRLRGVALHPSTPGTILVGSVSGGIWKSEDDGATWRAIDDFLPVLAIGSMLVDPDVENRVWVGTGEGFFNVDAMQGMGIFRSDDFGESWVQLAATDGPDFHYVNRLGRIPGTDVLLAATRTGIHRSADLGASWTEVSGQITSSRGFVDLKVDPSDPTHVLAYHYGSGEANRRLFESVDAGLTWTALGALAGLPTTDIGRMEIAIAADGTEYLAVANAADATRGMWRRAVGSPRFSQTASATAFIERQGWYDLVMAVDPSDPDRVFAGAVDLFGSTDGGATIDKKTFWNPGPGQNPQYVHADLHVVAFATAAEGGTSEVYVGSDGGLFKSSDGGDTWTALNDDLRVTQYYGIAAHPDGDRVIGGTQDNGSHLFFGDNSFWLQWFGGDGGYCGWDQQQTDFMYGATPFAGVFGSGDGGSSAAGLPIPSTAGALFITPFVLDPLDGNRMMVGTNRVWLSEDVRQLGASSWTDVSGLIGTVSALAFDPHDSETAYAGRPNGALYRTTGLTGGGAWSRIDAGLPTGSDITSIEIDPHDPSGDTIYVTLADYGTDRVWKSTDGGAVWTAIHGDLPDIPMFSLRVDPFDAGRLWLGSELGLFTTGSNLEGAGFAWHHYDYGVAFTRVQQLVWADGGAVLWAGTHGRGIYRIARSPGEVAFGPLDDLLECNPDGYLDRGETAALPVSVTNRGEQDMDGVTVSLASGYDGLQVLTPPQDYGTIAPGATVSADFDLWLGSLDSCLDSAELVATVTDGGGSAEARTTLTLAADPVVEIGTLSDGAEGPDTVLTTEAAVGVDDWGPVTSQANSGTRSWFASDVALYADKSLLTPWMEVGGGTTVVTFSLYYDLEGNATQYWDGAVLELRTEGGEWVDIGHSSTVPYDGPLYGNNTIGIRDAWSGVQTAWRDATVDLGTAYNGETVQIRFRLVCDTAAANVGFWVDDIAITNVSWLAGLDCDDATFCNLIFADGFETGDTGAWSLTVP